MPARKLEDILIDFFESQQQTDADFVGEQREWHLPRLNRVARDLTLMFPVETAWALSRMKTPYDER